jgi:type II secretion system protein I
LAAKKMNDRRPMTRPAFTFIEVLMALAISAIAVLGLLRLHLISIATADTAQAKAQAVFVAQEKIAEASAPGYPQQGTESGTVQRNNLNFTWRTEVTNVGSQDVGGLALKDLRRIRTLVTWQQGTSPKKLQMTTYVADSKINE